VCLLESNVAVRVNAALCLFDVCLHPKVEGHSEGEDHSPFTEVAEGEEEATHTHQADEVEGIEGAVGESSHHVWSILCVCI